MININKTHSLGTNANRYIRTRRIAIAILLIIAVVALIWVIPDLLKQDAVTIVITALAGAVTGIYFAVVSSGFKASFVISAIVTSVILAGSVGYGIIDDSQSRFISVLGLIGVGVSVAEEYLYGLSMQLSQEIQSQVNSSVKGMHDDELS